MIPKRFLWKNQKTKHKVYENSKTHFKQYKIHNGRIVVRFELNDSQNEDFSSFEVN